MNEVCVYDTTQQSETNKFSKWKKKLSRFCHNKLPKNVEQKEVEEKKEVQETLVKVTPARTSEKQILLRGGYLTLSTDGERLILFLIFQQISLNAKVLQ